MDFEEIKLNYKQKLENASNEELVQLIFDLIKLCDERAEECLKSRNKIRNLEKALDKVLWIVSDSINDKHYFINEDGDLCYDIIPFKSYKEWRKYLLGEVNHENKISKD